MSFYGIYSLVFIVETDMMTQWPTTREGGAAMFGSSVWLNGDPRGTKQLRGRRGLPQIWGSTLGVTSEVTVVKKPYLMMDVEGEEELCTRKRAEPDGLRLRTY